MVLVEGMAGQMRLPLLDLVEAGEEGHRNKNDDCFLAMADFELWVDQKGFVSLCPCHVRWPVESKCYSRCPH